MSQHIRLYEHQSLKVDEVKSGIRFSEKHRQALEKYYGSGSPFFSLIHRGVKFNEHVGVLQVGNLTIEVLPKADNDNDDGDTWQRFLITMLRAAGILPEASSSAALRLKSNSILDLYMQLFLQEVGYLIRRGLIRKYRKAEGNLTALKGSLHFAKHVQQNLTHAEHFYTRHTIYDKDNRYNSILAQAVALVGRIASNAATAGEAASLSIGLPECAELKVTDELFANLRYDRKTEGYRKAIGMARLLLMRYHPDVRKGGEEVLALMFDMNELWEKYVARMLRRALQGSGYSVHEQVRNDFWKPDIGYMRTVRPDIVVRDAAGETILVLDTKWKCPPNDRPDDDDLKQMFVYNIYNRTRQSILLYPSAESRHQQASGAYHAQGSVCHLVWLPLLRDANTGMAIDLGELVKQFFPDVTCAVL